MRFHRPLRSARPRPELASSRERRGGPLVPRQQAEGLASGREYQRGTGPAAEGAGRLRLQQRPAGSARRFLSRPDSEIKCGGSLAAGGKSIWPQSVRGGSVLLDKDRDSARVMGIRDPRSAISHPSVSGTIGDPRSQPRSRQVEQVIDHSPHPFGAGENERAALPGAMWRQMSPAREPSRCGSLGRDRSAS